MADKTITSLGDINELLNNSITTDIYKHDYYLVSHPMSKNGSDYRDYTTYKISLEDLAKCISTAAYKAVSAQISTDLNLGTLAHYDSISSNTLVNANCLTLDRIKNYGPFAVEKNLLPTLSDYIKNTDGGYLAGLKSKLGFSHLAFNELITSADLGTNLLEPQNIKYATTLISTTYRDLCATLRRGLSGPLLSDHTLSALAHKDKIHWTEISTDIPFSKISNWQTTLDKHYLSEAKNDTFGSIKTGYLDNGKNYRVQVDGSGNAFVNVPWNYQTRNTTIDLSVGSRNELSIEENWTEYSDDNTRGTTSSRIHTATLTPYIENNLTGIGSTSCVAVFSGISTLSFAGRLSAGVEDKYYRANGTFGEIPAATLTAPGLMTAKDYKYLWSLTSLVPESTGGGTSTAGLNLATSSAVGGIKIGFAENYINRAVKLETNTTNKGKAYVSLLYADNDGNPGIVKLDKVRNYDTFSISVNNGGYLKTKLDGPTTTSFGAIKIGYTDNSTNYGRNYHVSTDTSGNAFVTIPHTAYPYPPTANPNSPNTASLIKTNFNSISALGYYGVRVDSNGNAYVQINQKTDSALTSTVIGPLLNALYPVGAIYITTASTCPMATLGIGTWVLITGKYLLASGTFTSYTKNKLTITETYSAGAEVPNGLPAIPDHKHNYYFSFSSSSSTNGYPHHGGGSVCNHSSNVFTTANANTTSNSIYGTTNAVRPLAYVVNVFRRVS